MLPIRQQKLEWSDQPKMNDFLRTAETGFLGLSDGTLPYVIPLNFVWMNEAIYFHGASEGRKVTIMEENANACFTVSEAQGTLTDHVPAKTDTAYLSVMIFGEAQKVNDLEEAVMVMQAMLDKYVPGYYEKALSKSHVDKYRSSLGSRTAVYKIEAKNITAKANPIQFEKLFYSGKTTQNDISN